MRPDEERIVKTAIVSGALANKPENGGNAWTRLCWISGLRQLGFRVFFVERLAPSVERNSALEESERALAAIRAEGDAALFDAFGAPLWGRPRPDLDRLAAAAAIHINISGHLPADALASRAACRVFVDDDPGYTQAWHAAGASRVAGHDLHFTFGTNIGRPDCAIPTDGIAWIPLLPPVSLAEWTPVGNPVFDRFTTVASWRGAYAPIEISGERLGPKAHRFRRILDLPRRTGLPFELALDIHPADVADIEALQANEWSRVDPAAVAGTPESYRAYVRGSGAEFSAAQGVYVATRSGWFSDRTARYLASGRPALVEQTGFDRTLPVGEGLLAFTTPDEAAEQARRLVADYPRHAAAARRLAETWFDARTVIGRVVKEAGCA